MRFSKILISLLFWIVIFIKPTLAYDKKIQVDLSTQTIFAYQDNKLIYQFPISSGRWYPTPTGTFKPWAKIPSTRMTGGNPAIGTYYNLPGVPYVVYFYQGYAIHGAYWHNNFGHPMSHGCINVAVNNAALLYKFIDYDTPITISGVTPST
jgi:lipoprotein-anchoring transpeptidase ErfK/SrfK